MSAEAERTIGARWVEAFAESARRTEASPQQARAASSSRSARIAAWATAGCAAVRQRAIRPGRRRPGASPPAQSSASAPRSDASPSAPTMRRGHLRCKYAAAGARRFALARVTLRSATKAAAKGSAGGGGTESNVTATAPEGGVTTTGGGVTEASTPRMARAIGQRFISAAGRSTGARSAVRPRSAVRR